MRQHVETAIAMVLGGAGGALLALIGLALLDPFFAFLLGVR